MTDYDKKLKRAINDVKRGVKNLRLMGLEIEVHEIENMMGKHTINIYVVDSYIGTGGKQRISLQKHLFTV